MEHLDIIQKIVATEKEARQTTALAEEERNHLGEELSACREQMRAAFSERAERRIADVLEKETAFAETRVAELRKELELTLGGDKRYVEENRENWCEELFEAVLAAVRGEPV